MAAAEEVDPGTKLAWRVSSSLDSAKPGEVLLLDDQGRVLGPSAMRRATLVGWGVVGSVVGVGRTKLWMKPFLPF